MSGTNHDIRNVDKAHLATLLEFALNEKFEAEEGRSECLAGKTEEDALLCEDPPCQQDCKTIEGS
jgi:hypothetical protein